jgi:hypothetical protein
LGCLFSDQSCRSCFYGSAALDLKEFGIKVTVVEPSGFRTGFLAKNSLSYTESRIEGYQAVKETQKRYLAGDGKQPGDPEKLQ